jgi:hypothetical protein
MGFNLGVWDVDLQPVLFSFLYIHFIEATLAQPLQEGVAWIPPHALIQSQDWVNPVLNQIK